MKFGVVNKSTTVNRFVLHTLQRNITHLAVITRKTNIKLDILKGGNWKRAPYRKGKDRCKKKAMNSVKDRLIISTFSFSNFADQSLSREKLFEIQEIFMIDLSIKLIKLEKTRLFFLFPPPHTTFNTLG